MSTVFLRFVYLNVASRRSLSPGCPCVCACGVSPLDTLFPQESRTPAPHLTTSSFVYQTQLSLCHQVRHLGASMANLSVIRPTDSHYHSDSLNKKDLSRVFLDTKASPQEKITYKTNCPCNRKDSLLYYNQLNIFLLRNFLK